MEEAKWGLFKAPLIWCMFCWMAGVPAALQITLGGDFSAWYMWQGDPVIPSEAPAEKRQQATAPTEDIPLPLYFEITNPNRDKPHVW